MYSSHGERNSDERWEQRDHGVAIGIGLCVSSEGAIYTLGDFKRRASYLCRVELFGITRSCCFTAVLRCLSLRVPGVDQVWVIVTCLVRDYGASRSNASPFRLTKRVHNRLSITPASSTHYTSIIAPQESQ